MLIGLPSAVRAQAGTAADSTRPAAKPADVASMDAILFALYDVISGPAGQRDWQRFRSLFAPGARLIPASPDSAGHPHFTAMSPDQFVEYADKVFLTRSFYERQIGKTVDTFGAVTQVFSAYASQNTPSEAPFSRGINSIQLYNDGTRWYVVTIYWNSERPDLKIPPRYITGK